MTVTLEQVTKELFLMNWAVLDQKPSYAQRLNARLRGRESDLLLKDQRRLQSMIRAKGCEFTNLYEENLSTITRVLTCVAKVSRGITEPGELTWMPGFAPTTRVELTGGDDAIWPFLLPMRDDSLTGEQALTMVNRLFNEELAERGYASAAFTLQFQDNRARKRYEMVLVEMVRPHRH
jgi:hypothetical protein